MDPTDLKNLIPEHAKDLKLNVATVLSAEGAPGLAEHQILGVALASAIAARNPALSARSRRSWFRISIPRRLPRRAPLRRSWE